MSLKSRFTVPLFVGDVLCILVVIMVSGFTILLIVLDGRVFPIIASAAVELSLPASPSGEIPLSLKSGSLKRESWVT